MARGPQTLDERIAPEQRRLVPTARTAKLLGLLVVPVAVLATGVTVVAASYSSFSAVTSSPSMSWTTGSVVLANDAGSAQFTVPGLKPGSTGTHCITVSSSGSLPSAVKLYAAAGATTTNSLSTYVDLVITQGTGGLAGSCATFVPLATGAGVYTGTLAAFSGVNAYASGFGSWTPVGVTTGSESRSFQIAYTVDPAAPNSAQNGSAALAFTWEAQPR